MSKQNTPPLLVSACLCNLYCRYNGEKIVNDAVLDLMRQNRVLPVCPEQLGGLPTPRPPSERLGDKVVDPDGNDLTEAFRRGARETLTLAQTCNCRRAVLKARSPSCGANVIYDGTFTGKRVSGDGVTAELLKANGIEVMTEEEL